MPSTVPGCWSRGRGEAQPQLSISEVTDMCVVGKNTGKEGWTPLNTEFTSRKYASWRLNWISLIKPMSRIFSLKRKRGVVPPVGDLKENSLPALHFPHWYPFLSSCAESVYTHSSRSITMTVQELQPHCFTSDCHHLTIGAPACYTPNSPAYPAWKKVQPPMSESICKSAEETSVDF